MDRIMKAAEKIIKKDITSASSHEVCCLKKMTRIMNDDTHPLHPVLAQCESRRAASGRLLSLKSRTNRFRESFLPTAVRLFNCHQQ